MLGEESHEDPESDAGEALGVIPRFCRELFSRADYLHSQNPPEEQVWNLIPGLDFCFKELVLLCYICIFYIYICL